MFLYRGQPYSLKLSRLNWPTQGLKICAQADRLPALELGCFVACNQNSECLDNDPATEDTCVFPGSCHAYCKHDTGSPSTSTTFPANAEAQLKASSEYRECFS